MTKKVLERAFRRISYFHIDQGNLDCWEIDCPKRRKQATTCFAPHKPTCAKYIMAYFIRKAQKEG